MKKNKIHNIFEPGTCLNIEQMQDYLAGKLSAKEEYLFEKHINACALCRDEFEGLQAMKEPNKLPLIVLELNKSIDKKLISNNKKTKKKRSKLWRIAATLILLVGSGAFIALYIQKMSSGYVEQESLSQEFEQEVPTLENLDTDNYETESKSEDKIDLTQNEPNKSITELKKEKIATGKINKSKLSPDQKDVIVDNKKNTDDYIKEEKIDADSFETISSEESEENDIAIIEESFAEDTADIIISRAKMTNPGVLKKQAVSYLQLGINAYEAKDYTKALEYLKIAVKQTKDINKSFYYIGLTYYYTNNYKKSFSYFDKLSKQTDNIYYWDAVWFKSQILMKQNKIKNAKELLKKITKSESLYKNRAQHQLDSLKSGN